MESELFAYLNDRFSDMIYGTIAVVILLEILAPHRILQHKMTVRWLSNVSIGLFNIVLQNGVLALAGIGAAVSVGHYKWGVLNLVSWPTTIEILLTIVVLDAIHYWIHRLYYLVPLLWRLHLVHHSDLDFDISTAFRHHPFEGLISLSLFVPIIALLGLPPLGVLCFTILRSVISYFEHANLKLPAVLDSTLRWFMVTPEMHRIHHSALQLETDSNFGDLFPYWDRLFRTYCEQPLKGHQGMTLGLNYLRDPHELWLHRLLMQPCADITEGTPVKNHTEPDINLE